MPNLVRSHARYREDLSHVNARKIDVAPSEFRQTAVFPRHYARGSPEPRAGVVSCCRKPVVLPRHTTSTLAIGGTPECELRARVMTAALNSALHHDVAVSGRTSKPLQGT